MLKCVDRWIEKHAISFNIRIADLSKYKTCISERFKSTFDKIIEISKIVVDL